MEENKIITEEVTVDEEVKVEEVKVEEPAAEAPAPEKAAPETEAKAEEPAAEAPAEEASAEEAPAAEETASEGPAEEAPTPEQPSLEEEYKKFENDVNKFADDTVNKLKELVNEGNVSRIRIRKDDTVILNLPMTAGLIGTALGLFMAPWAMILAAITTVGFKCTVEVVNKDGSVTVIHGKEK